MSSIESQIAESHPSLRRGIVWCTTCGSSRSVDSSEALRSGWPMCCGYTMTIDSPEERRALASPPRPVGQEGGSR